MKLSFTTKIDGFLSFIPRWMLRYFFAGLFLNLTLCVTKLRVLVLGFSYFADNSSILGLCLEIQKNLGPKIMLQI